MMNNGIVRPTIAKLICRNYPIIKKRPPIAFFFDDVKNNNCDDNLKKTIENIRAGKKVTTPLRSIWKSLNALQKMKYYELAKLDETRYREQTSLWVSKVASVIGTQDEPNIEKLNSFKPDPIKTELEAALLMTKYQKRYRLLVEADSLKKLMRDLTKQTEDLSINKSKDEIVQDLTKTQRTLLSKPLRPSNPYLIYLNHNIYNLKRLHAKKFPEERQFQRIVSREWAKLSRKKKQFYINMYEKQVKEYTEALQKFNTEKEANGNDFSSLESKISKSRANLSLSIRKKMRASDVVPLNTRNPFIFFFKEHACFRKCDTDYAAHLDKLVHAYMNLSDEEKLKYKKLFEEDLARYENEKKRYLGIVVKLIELMKKQAVEQ